jgi:hypothetical protein
MSKATFLRELEPTVRGQEICLIELDGKHYVVSSIPSAPDHRGPETLAFAADASGEITSYADLAGGRGMSREQTILQLETNGEDRYGSDTNDMVAAMRVVATPPGPSYYVQGEDAE